MKPAFHAMTADLKRVRNVCWAITFASLLALTVFTYLTWVVGAEASWGYFMTIAGNIYIISATISAWRKYFDVKNFTKPRKL